MNFPLFIAKKIYHNQDDKRMVSRPAIRIATIGVAIGLAVMIVTVSVVLGFKHTIRDKVVGFGGHIQVHNVLWFNDVDPYTIAVDDSLLNAISHIGGVKHTERYSVTQGLLKTDDDFLGVAFKGVGPEFDTAFLKAHLLDGELPQFSDTTSHYQLLVSKMIADKLKLNKAVFPGIQGGPLMHVIAAKAVCLGEALQPSYKEYIHQVVKNADVLANALIERGFDIISGGTDNHLMLVDLRPKGITGKQAENLLWEAHITCNKNAIPNDPEKPTITSGIRIGTPAVTTRGMKEDDMVEIADVINHVLENPEADRAEDIARIKVLTDRYPIYE